MEEEIPSDNHIATKLIPKENNKNSDDLNTNGTSVEEDDDLSKLEADAKLKSLSLDNDSKDHERVEEENDTSQKPIEENKEHEIDEKVNADQLDKNLSALNEMEDVNGDSNSSEAKEVEHMPVDSNSSEAKEVEHVPVDCNSSEAKEVEHVPVDSNSSEAKEVEHIPVESCFSKEISIEEVLSEKETDQHPSQDSSNPHAYDESSLGNPIETEDEKSSDENKNEPLKIKLRSFASLCDELDKEKENICKKSDGQPTSGPMTNIFSSEISGVTVGDIVQHGNIVESDESGVMHLRISNVVGGEDCITGLIGDQDQDNLAPIQISSLASLIEPLSPEEKNSSKGPGDGEIVEIANVVDKDPSKNAKASSLVSLQDDKEKGKTIVKILRSPLVVSMMCACCKLKTICKFRSVSKANSDSKVSYICSDKCKEATISSLPENHVIEKPRLYFSRLCGMCGKDMANHKKDDIFSWQTREFCDKLCLADHIGEIARSCFSCTKPVRVLFMGKYCVRFGSDVHQFCSNKCLECYKSKISVCGYCQKNLMNIETVRSSTNKVYCSNKCLKRAQRRDIGQQHYNDNHDCTVCDKNGVNIFEFINGSSSVWLCSDPCLNVYKYVNQVKSVNCCLCARLLNAEDSPSYFFNGHQIRVFCADSCLSVFIISARKIVTCNYCKVKKYNFDMIGHYSAEMKKEAFYCSICCLNFVENKFGKELKSPEDESKSENDAVPDKPVSQDLLNIESTPTTNASPEKPNNITPILKECNMCTKVQPAQFHMVMSDSTLRSFCSYVCATQYKCTYGFQVSLGVHTQSSNISGSPQPSQVENNATFKDASKKDNGKIRTADIANINTKPDLKDLLNILKIFEPPTVCNKSTMCRPIKNSTGSQSTSVGCDQESQTDSSRFPSILPIPIPVYVPTPQMMYSANVPIPLIVPLPIPVPVFIPTTEKTTKDIKRRIKDIQDNMPSEPIESEMLLLAREAEDKLKDDNANENSSLNKPQNDIQDHDLGSSFDQNELAILASLEDTLSIYHNQEPGSTFLRGVKRKQSLESAQEFENIAKKPRAALGSPNEENDDHLNTYYGLVAWRDWSQKQTSSADFAEDPCEMSVEELCRALISFLKDLKRPDGQEYEIDTIFYIILGLQKHLFEKDSTHCIFLETDFKEFIFYFNELIQKRSKALSNIERHSFGETRITEEMMWEARQLGVHTPHVLLNTLFYFNTKYFKLKTPEEHMKLSFSQIHKRWERSKLSGDSSYNRTCLLKYIPDDAKETDAYEMVENKETPVRCPIKLYGFYISKCPLSVRDRPNTYYVYPEQSCLADSPVWFSTVPLELSTLERMLNRILLVKEIQQALTK